MAARCDSSCRHHRQRRRRLRPESCLPLQARRRRRPRRRTRHRRGQALCRRSTTRRHPRRRKTRLHRKGPGARRKLAWRPRRLGPCSRPQRRRSQRLRRSCLVTPMFPRNPRRNPRWRSRCGPYRHHHRSRGNRSRREFGSRGTLPRRLRWVRHRSLRTAARRQTDFGRGPVCGSPPRVG